MTTRLVVLAAAIASLTACKKTIALTPDAQRQAQVQKNRAHFLYPDAEIHSTIAGGHSTMYVTRNYSRENGSDKLAFGSGTGSEKMGKFQGRYTYQFVGQSHQGDVYVFTIDPPDGTHLTIPYIYTGKPATIYDQQGMKVAFAE
jgi:hypothetical protein